MPKQLKIIKIQRSLFSSDRAEEILVYGVDPITLERNTLPQPVDWGENIDNVLGEDYVKGYWLVYGDMESTAFIEPIFPEKWVEKD